jgi:hypothetical protein
MLYLPRLWTLQFLKKKAGVENIPQFCAISIVISWIVTAAAEASSSITMPSVPPIIIVSNEVVHSAVGTLQNIRVECENNGMNFLLQIDPVLSPPQVQGMDLRIQLKERKKKGKTKKSDTRHIMIKQNPLLELSPITSLLPPASATCTGAIV